MGSGVVPVRRSPVAEPGASTVTPMLLLVLAVVLGAGAGLLRPPLGRHAARPAVGRIGWLALGAALNAASVLLAGDLATLCLAGSLTSLLWFAAGNRAITGVAVIGVGLLLNLTALGVHSGMPVRAEAMVRAGLVESVDDAAGALDEPRRLETSRDVLPILGDVLPLAPTKEVLSFGDVVIVLGVGDAVRDLARRRTRARSYPAATTATKEVQDWGTAPSAAPVSGSQCSANPLESAPATIDLDRSAADASPDLVAASHSR